ncbi:hypothetical protein CPC08DRAFT_467603 [Agrocybe pediades]|nr:hypothetical protein CPC08DRAFT_467603 [Agrocybe pediades]
MSVTENVQTVIALSPSMLYYPSSKKIRVFFSSGVNLQGGIAHSLIIELICVTLLYRGRSQPSGLHLFLKFDLT